MFKKLFALFTLNIAFISACLCGEESANACAETSEKKENGTIKEKVKEETKDKESGPPRIGNFALPSSQQPAALFGFGGNIIDEGEIQLILFADDFIGDEKTTIDLIPSVLFAITDSCSIYFNFPFTPLLKNESHRSRGLEDFFIQLEYAFYNKKTYAYTDQATIVGNITLPTGSVRKDPPTGFGSTGFFLGGTYYRTLVNWLFFTSHGATLTTTNRKTKIGDQFFYQFGLGRNMPSPEGWIYAWLLEVDGQYSQRNNIRGKIDKNSGGNVIYVTPSLWCSSKNILWQFGVSFPINQNLYGHQKKVNYALNFNVAWSFY